METINHAGNGMLLQLRREGQEAAWVRKSNKSHVAPSGPGELGCFSKADEPGAECPLENVL